MGSQFLRLQGGKVSRSDSYTLKGLENGHTMFERILRNPGQEVHEDPQRVYCWILEGEG